MGQEASIPQPTKVALAKPLNITIFKHGDINVKFPKMGIWVLSDIGNIDVVSINDTKIKSHLESAGKEYTVLAVKEKWDYSFKPPYVFTGPFGTVGTAIAWAKSNPNQAQFEKAVSMGAAQLKPPPTTASKAPPEPEKAPAPTAKQFSERLENDLKKLPQIKDQTKATLAKFNSVISDCKSKGQKDKCAAIMRLKSTFEDQVSAFESCISALKNASAAYNQIGPSAQLDQINGNSIDNVLYKCAECNAYALEFLDKLISLG